MSGTQASNILDHEDVDLEYHNWFKDVTIPATEFDGSVGQNFGQHVEYEGESVIDFEDRLDRAEAAMLLYAETRLSAVLIDTEGSGQGEATIAGEVSAAPNLRAAVAPAGSTELENDPDLVGGDITDVDINFTDSDTADIVHRPVRVGAIAAHADDTNGNAANAIPGEDVAAGPDIAEDWILDDRDELFLNGSVATNGMSDADVNAVFQGYLVYASMDQDMALDLLTR